MFTVKNHSQKFLMRLLKGFYICTRGFKIGKMCLLEELCRDV